ncbi:hypothetical protein ACCO45_008259 [Purpureocillium lilacinum]|uniref:Uncharacterized protein n=1 Tax=Purpureocillium lilacinum TaxID=33203 RepID=A0ACC4DN49_PURLI
MTGTATGFSPGRSVHSSRCDAVLLACAEPSTTTESGWILARVGCAGACSNVALQDSARGGNFASGGCMRDGEPAGLQSGLDSPCRPRPAGPRCTACVARHIFEQLVSADSRVQSFIASHPLLVVTSTLPCLSVHVQVMERGVRIPAG